MITKRKAKEYSNNKKIEWLKSKDLLKWRIYTTFLLSFIISIYIFFFWCGFSNEVLQISIRWKPDNEFTEIDWDDEEFFKLIIIKEDNVMRKSV